MKKLAFVAALMATGISHQAVAQTRVQAPEPPPKPGFKAPEIDPVMQRLNELKSELDALKESAGKQIVVFHFTPTEISNWYDNSYPANQERSIKICKDALDDRFGRMVSYKIRANGDYFYFGHVVCETKP